MGVAGKFIGEQFQRDIAIQLAVAGAEDTSHSAGTDDRDDVIRADIHATSSRVSPSVPPGLLDPSSRSVIVGCLSEFFKG